MQDRRDRQSLIRFIVHFGLNTLRTSLVAQILLRANWEALVVELDRII